MSQPFSSSALALGLLLSALLSGCQASGPAAARPMASFGLGAVETAEPVLASTVRTLSEALDDAEAAPVKAVPAAPAETELPETAPVDPAPVEPEPLATPRPEASQPAPTAPDAPALDGPIKSGVWEMTWYLGDEESKTEPYHLTLQADGSISVEDAMDDPEFENAWGEDELQFAGGCGPMFATQTGFSCQRYQLRVVSEEQLEGTVSIMVNYRWIELPVTAAWVER